MPPINGLDALCEEAVSHAADALKEICRAMSPRRSGAHARRDLENAIIHLQQAKEHAAEAFARINE